MEENDYRWKDLYYMESSGKEILIQEKKLLEAKILEFRGVLKEIVTKEDREKLKELAEFHKEEDFSKEFGILLKAIENNPIIKEFDKHFDISYLRSGNV